MAPPTKKPSKPIFKTSSPFTETKWPSVSHEDQEVITDLLCHLLTPLGEYRRAHVTPSKGKKRKRDPKSSSDDGPRPPVPAIGSHVLVGLNSVTRHLESMAATTAPPAASVKETNTEEPSLPASETDAEQRPNTLPRPLSLVLVTHPQPSLSPSHAHIPTLLHLSTIQQGSTAGSSNSTRLITLPTSKDNLLANALHIPRVGALGIFEDAPGAKALEDYARKHVGLTECAWVEEALESEWRGLNVQQA